MEVIGAMAGFLALFIANDCMSRLKKLESKLKDHGILGPDYDDK